MDKVPAQNVRHPNRILCVEWRGDALMGVSRAAAIERATGMKYAPCTSKHKL